MRRSLVGLGAAVALTFGAGVRDASACGVVSFLPPTQLGAPLSDETVAITGVPIVVRLVINADNEDDWVTATPVVTIDDPLGDTIDLSAITTTPLVVGPDESIVVAYVWVPTVAGTYTNLTVSYEFERFADAALTQPIGLCAPGTIIFGGTVAAAPAAIDIDLGQLRERLSDIAATIPFGKRRALLANTRVVLEQVERGNDKAAAKLLEKTILARMDGCAETGAPDRNDFVTTCEAQAEVYPIVRLAAALLEWRAGRPQH